MSITELPVDISVERARQSGDRIEVIFRPDGHRAEFDASWLRQFGVPDSEACSSQPAPPPHSPVVPAGGADDYRTEDAKRLWAAADIAAAFPQGAWRLLQAQPAHRQACLEAVLRDGFVLLRDVPAEPGMVLEVARRFGFIRETEHGPVSDMKVSTRPPTQVFSSQFLEPRTGYACRDQAPTLQFAHCLRQAPRGGETLIVDGFHAAATLRAQSPHDFAVLAKTEVTFAFADAVSDLRATRPIISVDSRGRIREVRLDATLMQPVRLAPADVVAFYQAYRGFAEIIRRPREGALVQLRAGDCLVLDNSRVMLGRNAFSGPQRHMQLCWAEIDELASALGVMRRVQRNGHRRGGAGLA